VSRMEFATAAAQTAEQRYLGAEEARQTSEERYRRIVETANEGIWLLDAEARTTFINRRMAEILGCPVEELIGRKLDDFVFEEDQPLAQERIKRNLSGQSGQFDFRFRRADGREVLVLGCTSPVTNGQGKIAGALGMFSDITERKQAEATLRASEERFRLMANMVPSCVWTATADGSLNYANDRWYAFSGLTLEQTAGLEWVDAIHPDDRERCLAAWKTAIRQGQPYEVEVRNRGAHGDYRWFLTRAVPERDSRGTVTGWFGTATDIQAQKQAEEELRDADRRKDEFLAMLSHELRNPLAAIRNALHVMRTSSPDDPEMPAVREVIERQVQLLAGIVDGLLDVFRVAHHKILLKNEPLDLAQLVRVTVDDHRRALEASGLSLTVNLPAEPVGIMGDRIRLSQVLTNLVQNAAKFTSAGGQVTVSVTADPGMHRAIVRVRDTGIGIAPEMLPHVFETFAQAEQSLDRSRGGLGLGLALVKGLVELHAGGVKATSPGIGRGSEFSFWVPLAKQPRKVIDGTPLNDSTERHLRILIVEDNDDTARTLGRLLTRYGHEVAMAHNGSAAVDRVRDWRPEVVLCDLGLPGMDGYEVARTLRQDPATDSLRLIALSGYGLDDDRRRSEQAGFDLHLTKPVDPSELQRLLAVIKVG
jgi:PAS domain S-box-containing protein